MSKYELKFSLIESICQSFLDELFNFYTHSEYDLGVACTEFCSNKPYVIKSDNFEKYTICFDSEEDMFLFLMEWS